MGRCFCQRIVRVRILLVSTLGELHCFWNSGKRYVAHKTGEMSWDCIITVKSRQLWAAWRTTVLGE